MPQKRAASKELRKSKRRRIRNVKVSSGAKTLVKKFDSLLATKKVDEARTLLKAVCSKLSKAVTKGVMHKSTVSRKISRLSRNLDRAAKEK